MLARITFRNRSGKSQALASALKGRRYHKEFLNQKHGRGAHSRVRLELLEKYEARLLGSKASGLGSLRISRAVLAETPREAWQALSAQSSLTGGKKAAILPGSARSCQDFRRISSISTKLFSKDSGVLGGPARS